MRAYPQLVQKDQDWISRQLVSVNLQQADRDFNIGEFYRRTGHPGSAYFYYELVLRRYPNTEYADKASARKNEMRDKVAQEQSAPPETSRNPAQVLQRMLNLGGNPNPAPASLPQGILKN